MKSMRCETRGYACDSRIRRSITAALATAAPLPATRSGIPAISVKMFRRFGTRFIAGKLTQVRRPRGSILDEHQPVVAGFCAPGFAGPAQHLADLRAALAARERLEFLRGRVEADNGIGQEVGQPNLVLLVDIDGVASAARIARQQPRLPILRGRLV